AVSKDAEEPVLELAELALAVRVVEAEHGHAVGEGRELLGRLLAHALRGAVRGDEVGVLRLEIAELALQAVVLLVGDLRRVQDVVEVLVAADLLAQLADARPGVGRAHRFFARADSSSWRASAARVSRPKPRQREARARSRAARTSV